MSERTYHLTCFLATGVGFGLGLTVGIQIGQYGLLAIIFHLAGY